MNKIPFYFPPANGRYEVKPGLFPLGTDFGNDRLDQRVFQIDSNYREYIRQKNRALNENIQKYFCTDNPSLQSLIQVSNYIAKQLCYEYPEYFTLEKNEDHLIMHCCVEKSLNQPDVYIPTRTASTDINLALSAINDLMQHIQEDIAIIELNEKGQDCISLLHLCFPNHWSAEDKIGKSFISSHMPVPGMSKINQRITQLLDAMINKGPFVRFAWGLSTDRRLNHHPEAPASVSQKNCSGRHFDPEHPELYLRVERQVINGFPDINAALFTIRTYFYDVSDIKNRPEKRDALVSALQTMSPEALTYKGLADSQPAILDWLARR